MAGGYGHTKTKTQATSALGAQVNKAETTWSKLWPFRGDPFVDVEDIEFTRALWKTWAGAELDQDTESDEDAMRVEEGQIRKAPELVEFDLRDEVDAPEFSRETIDMFRTAFEESIRRDKSQNSGSQD